MSAALDSNKTYELHDLAGIKAEIQENDIVCVTTALNVRSVITTKASSFPKALSTLQITRITSDEQIDNLIDNFAYNDVLGASQQRNDSTTAKTLITVLISTNSGAKQASACYDQLLKPLFDHFHLHPERIGVHTTTSAASIAECTTSIVLPRAQCGRHQLIILISGDGGIVDLVDILYTSLTHAEISSFYVRPTIALLPFGTGNALANSTRIAADKTHGLATLARGVPKALPLFKVTLPAGSFALDGEGKRVPDSKDTRAAVAGDGRIVYGAVVFSWALHSTLVAESDTLEYRKHGSARFQMAAKELLFPADGTSCHAFRGTLSYRSSAGSGAWVEVPRDSHAYVLLTMVSNLEATFCISPKSEPLDGKMWLVHFGMTDTGGQAVMRVMEMAYDGGKHVDEADVGYQAVSGMRLQVQERDEKWRRFCVDGKIYVVPYGGTVQVERETRELVELLVKQ